MDLSPFRLLSGFQGLPEFESEDELQQNFSVIFQRLKKQEPDVLGFMTKYHVEIEARDYYWNEFLGGRPNALRRETADGEFEVVIQVPPDASDYVIFDYVVRSIKRQPLFKEYYDSLPNQPALSVPITQAPIDRLGAFIVGDEERLRRFRKEQYMLNAGATEGEISEVRWTAFIQDVLGSGGIAENALCTIAGSQILRPKVTIVTGTPKPVPTLKVKPCSPYDAARQVRIRWKQPTTNANAPNAGAAPKPVKSKLLKDWADAHRTQIPDRGSVNIIKLADGEFSISVSSAVPETVNPLLSDLLKSVKKPSLFHGECGEINNINNLLNAHPEVKTLEQAKKLFAGATTESAFVRANPADPLHGTYQGRCSTCRDVTKELGIVPQE